jgi:Tol biopolymer transport system component
VAAGACALLTMGAIIYIVVGRTAPNGEVIAPGPSVHRQVTFTGKEVTPALSPDGTRIAYISTHSANRTVMVQALDGGRPIEIFSAPEAGALRWSPDGSDLMFWARGGGTDGLFIAPASGGSARKLVNGIHVACWSPDGSAIAVALFVARKIMFLNRVGEEQRSIALRGSKEWIWDLDWSPANDLLLFVANDEQRRPAIWTIRPDGRDQTKVFSSTSEISAARWAPPGDAVYFFRRVSQTVSLYKAFVRPDRPAAELTAAPLISGLETDGSFALSANGNRLVYARAPYHSNLWLVERGNAVGGEALRQTQLTHGTSIIERPRVSPDGRLIVFNMGYESRANLYTIPALGGTPKQLTFLNSFSVGGVWSADGRKLAFASTEGGKPRVWIVNADGSSPQPLSQG